MSLGEVQARIAARAESERTRKVDRLAEVRAENPADAAKFDEWRGCPRFVDGDEKPRLTWLRNKVTGEEWKVL